jgi:hypothetical protein
MNNLNTKPLLCRFVGMALVLFAMSFAPGSQANLPEPASAAVETAVDLVDERPSAIGAAWGYSTQAVGWVWGTLRDNVFSWISPPTPTSLTQSIAKQDAIQLFKLLGQAGYKLKKIETDVGIIPGLSFTFGQKNELSEADYEYLETQVEEWEQTSSGLSASLQRKIIKTLVAINLSGEYHVETLVVELLPLPDVSFEMSPKETFLGEEGSTLMTAIQRVDRGIRKLDKHQ